MVATQQLEGFTRSQAARQLEVSGETISRAMREGKLSYVATPLGRVIPVDEFERFRLEFEERHRRDGRRG